MNTRKSNFIKIGYKKLLIILLSKQRYWMYILGYTFESILYVLSIYKRIISKLELFIEIYLNISSVKEDNEHITHAKFSKFKLEISFKKYDSI